VQINAVFNYTINVALHVMIYIMIRIPTKKRMRLMDEYLDDEIEIVCIVCGVVNDWSNVCMDCENENHGND
jgi:hypothetical protein